MGDEERIVIGIDPGTRVTGYGIIVVSKKSMKVLDFGCIRPPPQALLSERYFIIFESLEKIFEKYQPHEMAIETQFFAKNPQSALKLGSAQGVAIVQAKRHKVRIFGYSPTQIKAAIVGTGKASKWQMQGAIQRFLQLKKPPQPQDASDALGCAVCHVHSSDNVLSSIKKREI